MVKFKLIQKCDALYKILGVDVNELSSQELIEYLESLILDLKERPCQIPQLIVIKMIYPNR